MVSPLWLQILILNRRNNQMTPEQQQAAYAAAWNSYYQFVFYSVSICLR